MRRATTRLALPCALLVAAVVAVYGQSAGFAFVGYDDDAFLAHNPAVRDGLSGAAVARAFSGRLAGGPGAVSREVNWIPLTWISHMLDVELYGLDPGGHHRTNVALHAANAVLLLLLLHALTGAVWRPALVAGLFALHPLSVESVAWVSQRKTLLSTLFALLSVAAYARYARRAGRAWYLAALALLAASLASKATFVTLPFLLLLLDYWPLERLERANSGRRLLEKLPLLLLALAAGATTLAFQRPAMAWGEEIPLAARAANALLATVGYLARAIHPVDLHLLYQHPYAAGHAPPPPWQPAAAGALLLALTLGAWRARGHRYLLVGWLWFGVGLLPVIGLVQVGMQGMADRYTYGPLIGIWIAAVWGLDAACAQRASRWRGARRAAAAAGAALVGLCALGAHTQAAVWRDSPTLFGHALARDPDNVVILTNLGVWLEKQGRRDEAIERFRRASELAPRFARPHAHLALALAAARRSAEALHHFELAVRYAPQEAVYLNNFAWWLATHPDPRWRDAARAGEIAERANRLTGGGDPAVLDTLAAARAAAGRFDAAVEIQSRALAAAGGGDAGMRGRLDAYRARRPHIEPARP